MAKFTFPSTWPGLLREEEPVSERAQAWCAHNRVSYRTEQIVGGLTRGWWECDSNCGTKFGPVQAPTEGVSPQPSSNAPVIPDSSVEPRGADSKTAP